MSTFLSKPAEGLVELYTSYKTSTKYVLEWLRLNSGGASRHSIQSHFKSTKDILFAAEQVRQQGVAVPSSVITTLADAIRRRQKVLQIYKSQSQSKSNKSHNQDDLQHKAFIARLEQVLQVLLPLQVQNLPRASASLPKNKNKTSAPDYNRFTPIEKDSDPATAEYTLEALADTAIETERPDPTLSEQNSLEPILLEDDDIGEWIELSFLLYEMDTILEQINSYWSEAARHEIALPLAAWISTSAFAAVGRICMARHTLVPDAKTLMEKWIKHKTKGIKIRFTEMPDLKCQTGGRFADDFAFHRIYLILHHMRTADEYCEILPTAGEREDPSSFIRILQDHDSNDENPGQLDIDDLAIDRMQESMRQLLQVDRGIAAIEVSTKDGHISEPLLPLMRQIINAACEPLPISLVFGLELLLSSYKAFLWSSGDLTRRNCRIEALNFARQVQKELKATATVIDTVEHSEHSLTLEGFMLHGEAEALNSFIKELRFDLYYQAPWTAGCHMMELLSVGSSFGLQLCSKFGYVCVVLHLYNALRTVEASIKQITCLDQFCEIFKDSLFLGSIPTGNFSSHFRRAIGQRPNTDRNSGELRFEQVLSANVSPKRKLKGSDISAYYQLHNESFQTTEDFLVRIGTDRSKVKPSESIRRSIVEEVHSRPFNVFLEKMKNVAQAEFQGEPALARINFLVIFRFCLQVLDEMGAMVQQSDTITSQGTKVSLGFGYCEMILQNLVKHLQDDSMRRLIPYWRELNNAKAIFAKFDKRHGLKEMHWSFE